MNKTGVFAFVLLALAAASWTAGPRAHADPPPSAGASQGTPAAGAAVADPTVCYTAVYDQQSTEGTYAHYGKGTWDPDRQLCFHVKTFTRSFLPKVNAIEAAQNNPFIHVMYVIDRTKARFYAPCGANIDADEVPDGVLLPGTYDLNTLTQVDTTTPSLGTGADCLITG